jgi:hypothetical protein
MRKTNGRGANVTAAEHALVVKFAKRCLREICKKEHEIGARWNKDNQISYADAVTRLRIKTKCRGQRSYGGDREISIDVSGYRLGRRRHREYRAFQDDPVIGNLFADNPEVALFAEVAHEVAHHVQMRYGHTTRYLWKTYRKAHGEAFQTIYRELRRALVNPLIEEAKEAA